MSCYNTKTMEECVNRTRIHRFQLKRTGILR